MNKKDKLQKTLKTQQKIEGVTPETELLLKLLPVIKTQMEWNVLTKHKFHKWGKNSFQSHSFYYPSDLLNNLEEVLR